MSLLDERQPTTSLKLIVFFVSVMTALAFGGMFAYSSMHPTSQAEQQQPAPETGVF